MNHTSRKFICFFLFFFNWILFPSSKLENSIPKLGNTIHKPRNAIPNSILAPIFAKNVNVWHFFNIYYLGIFSYNFGVTFRFLFINYHSIHSSAWADCKNRTILRKVTKNRDKQVTKSLRSISKNRNQAFPICYIN